MVSLLMLTLLAFTTFAHACEELCKNGTTDELVKKFWPIIDDVFTQAERDIGVSKCLQPMRIAYNDTVSESIKHDVFKLFKGKCQRNGVEPEGCPNPSCPVICGTPGSMCYHYDKLEDLAFNAVHSILYNITQPTSPVFQQVYSSIARSKSRRETAYMRFQPRAYAPDLPLPFDFMRQPLVIRSTLDDLYARDSSRLTEISSGLSLELQKKCGYEPHGSKKDLGSRCSWKKEMCSFILQYP
ncbi:hypothetical protein VNI00_002067 [Paramarasmius palmivorus]|uniref:Uncharacterized protein n=1 Tax=Paramarasmius palmivorus TaxID=297713 RepID=A0AAW0E0U8_9AGAR